MTQVSRQQIPLETAALIAFANGYLDAFTFVGHGGVFANAQTGNVILFGVGLARPDLTKALPHLWPVLAFIAGIFVARLLREREDPRAWRDHRAMVLGFQVVVLSVIAMLPADAPTWLITTTIGFASALQLSALRTVHSSVFVPIAMTGNLMRTTESFSDALHGVPDSTGMTAMYVTLVVVFGGGAAVGAWLTTHWHSAAAWVPAGLFLIGALLLVRRIRRHQAVGPPRDS